jgi:hypothetical protein
MTILKISPSIYMETTITIHGYKRPLNNTKMYIDFLKYLKITTLICWNILKLSQLIRLTRYCSMLFKSKTHVSCRYIFPLQWKTIRYTAWCSLSLMIKALWYIGLGVQVTLCLLHSVHFPCQSKTLPSASTSRILHLAKNMQHVTQSKAVWLQASNTVPC